MLEKQEEIRVRVGCRRSKHYHLFCSPNNFKVSCNSHKQFRVFPAETVSLFPGATMNCADRERAVGFGRGLS